LNKLTPLPVVLERVLALTGAARGVGGRVPLVFAMALFRHKQKTEERERINNHVRLQGPTDEAGLFQEGGK